MSHTNSYNKHHFHEQDVTLNIKPKVGSIIMNINDFFALGFFDPSNKHKTLAIVVKK